MSSRRAFLTGLATSLAAAPAIVRSASLMPIRGIVMAVEHPNMTAAGVLSLEKLLYAKAMMRMNDDLLAFGTGAVWIDDRGGAHHLPLDQLVVAEHELTGQYC